MMGDAKRESICGFWKPAPCSRLSFQHDKGKGEGEEKACLGDALSVVITLSLSPHPFSARTTQ